MILKFSGQHVFESTNFVCLKTITIDTNMHNYTVFDDGKVVEIIAVDKPRLPRENTIPAETMRFHSNTFKEELLNNVEITDIVVTSENKGYD